MTTSARQLLPLHQRQGNGHHGAPATRGDQQWQLHECLWRRLSA